MKKTAHIQLVLITAALASCAGKEKEAEWGTGNKTYVRGDSTAPYARAHGGGVGNALLWYYAFRPMGFYSNGIYSRQGYYSNAIPHGANIGSNGVKGNISRSGFGRSGARASS
jgi:hypothetical protein